jgi:hypothetical protein
MFHLWLLFYPEIVLMPQFCLSYFLLITFWVPIAPKCDSCVVLELKNLFIKQSVTHSKVSRSLVFKWHKRFSDGRGSLMDDKREGRTSFKTSDVVKNEVHDVIDGDRRLTVREVADKCVISKTTVHEIF